jgi:hypothetical protein
VTLSPGSAFPVAILGTKMAPLVFLNEGGRTHRPWHPILSVGGVMLDAATTLARWSGSEVGRNGSAD